MQTVIQNLRPTCSLELEVDASRLKRERRQISDRSTQDCPERKAVKVRSAERPEAESVDDAFGPSNDVKVSSIDKADNTLKHENLSDDDKG